jgi:hypothetical protein
MTLTSKESTALASSLLSAGIPTVFQLADGGNLATSLANAVFEGDHGAARLWGGFLFSIAALTLAGAAIIGPYNGTAGQFCLAAGVAALALAVIVVVEGGR